MILTVREGVDLGVVVAVNAAKAGKGVDAINVHGARTADTLTARSSEGERGVDLVLDLDQGVEDHWSGLVEVEGVVLQARLLRGSVGVPSVDLEGLQLLRLALSRGSKTGCRGSGEGSTSDVGGAAGCGTDGAPKHVASVEKRHGLWYMRLSVEQKWTTC